MTTAPPSAPHSIATALSRVFDRIAAAETKYDRAPGSVALLAVSKTRTADEVMKVSATGHARFGENQLQDALLKLDAISQDNLEWHFIGPLQSNKSRTVAERFDWIQSIDRERVARRLSEQRPAELAPLNVCLQYNVSGEESKSGVRREDLDSLAEAVAGHANLRLRGIMAIPQASLDPDTQRAAFADVRSAYEALRRQGFDLDTLSMGMSDDLESAIAEGSTMVRIGTAIFGPRRPRVQ
ncbi:MAG: YggS family pyridoxal phosphate-dependent enzyme [Chromatiales bacterium]|jgi:PLP dependent protein|nr:YggS family pyridoxal phosphate-dependent enzyme [Chromatiales bacterium]